MNLPTSLATTSDEADRALAAAAALPSVMASTRSVTVPAYMFRDGLQLPFISLLPLTIDSLPTAIGRFKVLEGRAADQGEVADAMMGFETAERLDVDVGDTFGVQTREDEPPVTVTIVGIIAYQGSFPTFASQPDAALLLTSAFQAAHAEPVDWLDGGLSLKLRGGAAGLETFRSELRAAGLPFDNSPSVHENAAGVRRLMRVEAGILWLIAAVVAGAAVVVIVQLLRREAGAASADLGVLRSLGMPRSTFAVVGARRGLGVGVLGAALGVGLAVAASPAFPRGISRTADPDHGVHADLAVLVPGAAITVLLSVVIGVAAVVLATRSRRARPQGVPLLSSVTSRLPPALAAGARSALSPSDSPVAAPVRLGLMGLGTIVAVLVAVVAMQHSFDRVVRDPDLSGSTWDVTLSYDDNAAAEAARPLLEADPAAVGFTNGAWWSALVNGREVYTVFTEAGDEVRPAIDRGRTPLGVDEIALGARELDALDVSIGDRVTVALGARFGVTLPGETTATVVGRSIVAGPIYHEIAPGEGAAATLGLARRIAGPDFPATDYFVAPGEGGLLREDAAALGERIAPPFWFPRSDRAGVRSLEEVGRLPGLLVAVLAVMASTALVHRLVTAARRHRRRQAILRSLGFTDRQLLGAGVTEGGLVAILAVAVAVPVALVGSVFAWRWVAGFLTVVPSAVLPLRVGLLVVAVGVLVGVIVGGVVSGVARGRIAPTLLRTE